MKQTAPIKKDAKSNVLRVLILEDNPADAELMERQLEKAGIRFVSAQAKTRSAFQQTLTKFRPDLILADYNLPKFDALQALELRKKMAPQTPFIIVTGSINEEIAVECMKRGADDYLLKDRIARLGEAVKHVLASRGLQVEKTVAEELLRVKELMYRTFIDSSTDMAFLKDDHFRHLLANQALCRFYGKPENEIIGKTDFELMAKSAAAKCRRSDKQAMAEKRIKISEETIGDLTFETRKFPVKLSSGRIGVGGYIRDITDIRCAQATIEAAAARWRTTFDSMNDAVCLLDKNGAVSQCNQAMKRFLGLPYKKIIGKNCLSMICGPKRKAVCAFSLMTKDGLRHEEEVFWRGRWYQVAVDPVSTPSGDFAGAVHVMTDITGQKESAALLLAASQRLEMALHSAKAGAWDWDMADNSIKWSPQMFDLFGLDAQTTPASFASWRTVLHPDDREEAENRIALALQQRIILDSDYRVVLSGGQIRWINAVGQGVYDAHGKPLQMVGICLDISERKKTEKILQESENRIRASLHEKEILLKEIHHRVKNNLQVISGLLTLQAAKIDDQRLLQVIKESQSRIWTMALIHQTLYQTGNLADIDMADYIRSLTGNLLSTHAQVAMPPTIRFDLQPLQLTIDKAIPLALIVNELLTNAMKHAFPGGRTGEIRISLQERGGTPPFGDKSRRAPDQETDVQPGKGTARRAPAYELTIADNGIGLPEGFDAANQKTLGLQLVAMLTRQLEGVMTITSRDGTDMRITFSHHEKNKA